MPVSFRLLAALCISLLARTACPFQEAEYAVKAAFLAKFTKFVKWPDSSHPGGAAVVIGVLTPDPFGSELDKAFAGKTIEGHPVVLTRVPPGRSLDGIHMLFVPREAEGRIDDFGSLLRRRVLVIGESPGFAQKKGQVGLTVAGGKLAFEINDTQLKAAGFSADSRLLQLARKVY